VARDCIGQIAVGKGGRRKTSLIQADYVMPMPREAIATQSVLKAKDVDCRCLLPESSFAMHDAWPRCRRVDPLNKPGRIAGDIAQARGLTGRARAKLKLDARCNLSGAPVVAS